MIDAHAGRPQPLHESRPEGVLANRADHVHLGPRKCGRYGLLGALAAGQQVEGRTREGLAGRGTSLYLQNEILVDGPDAHYPGHALTLKTVASRHTRPRSAVKRLLGPS